MPDKKPTARPKLFFLYPIDRELIEMGKEQLVARYGKRRRGFTDAEIARYALRKVFATKEIRKEHGNGLQ